MALTGQLVSVTVGDVLHLLASNSKSGSLRLTQPRGEGLIVLRRGKIIYAASDSMRETLGSMLLSRNLIDEEQLACALKSQVRSEKELRLGPILVSSGVVSQSAIEEVVGEQTQKVLAEFLNWKTGFFRFDSFEVPNCGEVEVAAPDFLIDRGLRADTLLLDLAQQLDDDGSKEAPEEAQEITQPPSPAPTPFASLKTIMNEFRSPSCTAEIASQILGFTQSLVTRGALFSTGPLGFAVVSHFGFDVEAGSTIQSTRVPLAEPSVLREAIARKSIYVGRMKPNTVNRDLVRSFGSSWPDEVLVAPLIVSGRVMMIVYGDNHPGGGPIGATEGFDMVLLHAGLAIERTLIEKRLAHAENLRDHG
jgi:hypothetical protein